MELLQWCAWTLLIWLSHGVYCSSIPHMPYSYTRIDTNTFIDNCSLSQDDNLTTIAVDCPLMLVDHGPVDKAMKHDVVIALKVLNNDQLEFDLSEISNPLHSRFGSYYTKVQIGSLVTNKQAVYTVLEYIHSIPEFELTSISELNQYLYVSAPIWVLECLLNTTFHHFSNTIDTTNRVVMASSYSVPTFLIDSIDAVLNVIDIPPKLVIAPLSAPRPVDKEAIRRMLSNDKELTIFGYVTPALLLKAYDIDNSARASPFNASNLSQAVFGTNNQYVSASDLRVFDKYFALNYHAPVTVDNSSRNHVLEDACPDYYTCGEANLDFMYLTAISPNVPTEYLYMGSGSFSQFLRDVYALDEPPRVISISYAMLEIFLSYSERYIFDIEARKLALLGVTIVAAAGDDGVSGNFQSTKDCGYTPYFPASSPYVVSVGATSGIEFNNQEVACEGPSYCGITTGGGFSNAYKRPAFQDKYVDAYFQSLTSSEAPYTGFSFRFFPSQEYNAYGRGYPDVSLAGSNYIFVVNGTLMVASGTSASTPVIAAMISLVNEARSRIQLPPLGWVTPSLYILNASTFTNDITNGTNKCLRGDKGCCRVGFNAKAGWDPVTGFGSLNYNAFYNRMLYLGSNSSNPSYEALEVSTDSVLAAHFWWWGFCLANALVIAYVLARSCRTKPRAALATVSYEYGAITTQDMFAEVEM